ncbi:hypothetical protein [Synechocystis sp. LKSZ1]|uniref:hypothetical protein n=1 Tax=Synechocystis sp. LKSZ1 TaxID=3144951 RepID=UPI00336BC35E
MNPEHPPHDLPAPCIIDQGIVVHKEDMKRLLNGLSHVKYIHSLDGVCQSQGEGWILEVFADHQQATLVMNQSLYLNVYSFDYLQLSRNAEAQTVINLWQDQRHLQLIPQTNPVSTPPTNHRLDADTLEAMMTQMLSAQWDVQLDDDLF